MLNYDSSRFYQITPRSENRRLFALRRHTVLQPAEALHIPIHAARPHDGASRRGAGLAVASIGSGNIGRHILAGRALDECRSGPRQSCILGSGKLDHGTRDVFCHVARPSFLNVERCNLHRPRKLSVEDGPDNVACGGLFLVQFTPHATAQAQVVEHHVHGAGAGLIWNEGLIFSHR
jgi:hypothetical protein